MFGISKAIVCTLALLSAAAFADTKNQLTSDLAMNNDCPDWLDHDVRQLHSSNKVNLCDLAANKPLLVINTASHCGFTSQFKGLEALHQRFKDQGLVVIGFPSNDFNQEAGSEKKTAEVCYINYGVTFFMTEKIHVKGNQAHPLFKYLAQSQGAPKWNFNKYLINAEGTVINRFSSSTSPNSQEITNAIQQLFPDRKAQKGMLVDDYNPAWEVIPASLIIPYEPGLTSGRF